MKRMIIDGSGIGSNNVVSNGRTFTLQYVESVKTRSSAERGFFEIVFRGFDTIFFVDYIRQWLRLL